MAIDDNTLYGLTGAQVKDLAGKVSFNGATPLFVPFSYRTGAQISFYKTSECNPGDKYTFQEIVDLWEADTRMVIVHIVNGRVEKIITVSSEWDDPDENEYGLSGYALYEYSISFRAAYTCGGYSDTTFTYTVITVNLAVDNAPGEGSSISISQRAASHLVYADPGGNTGLTQKNHKIQIGRNASTSGNLYAEVIAIGEEATASGDGSIALGSNTRATTQAVAIGDGATATTAGEVNIGSTTSAGYNGSAYKLLSGVYDPQSAHDAATKGYVDSVIPTIPTNVSSFTNDANYQNATQVSSAIATAVGQITEFSFEVVQTLPATGDTSTIYLVPITGSAQNTYDEYLYVNNAWEKIGSTDIDLSNYVQFTDLATVATTGDYNDLTNLPEGMVVLEYGTSTWADFLAAYNDNRVVYCKASSGSDPSVGDKTRMAFMAYVTNPTNPTLVEFQYYRSVTTKSASNQTDQVVVYKLASNGTWSVETRNTGLKIAAGTNMTSSYSGGVLTLDATAQAQQQADWNQSDTTAVDFIKNKPTIPTVNNATLTIQKNGTTVQTFTANASANKTANIEVPVITMQTTDPGEGATLAANNFIAVYQ